ncbi:hypothetical protein ACFFUB_05870 [Algimonas porphyrae]|uniref:Uncharacterized protein n=1 Tax=Algimonas porphyrae TaxID=1128113 RepID=A0ABQ5V758_9PROT|nr:hypothetical protein [Algimonas porphyrae]GLQ22102.1 hypothetical protein GCM10007854_30570 [Algimonas porphyrae]
MSLAAIIENAAEAEQSEMLRSLLEKVVIDKTGLTLQLNRSVLAEHIPICVGNEGVDFGVCCLFEPMTIRRRGQEMQLVIGAAEQAEPSFNNALVRLVARAALLREQLETGNIESIGEFAGAHGMHHADAKKLVPLGYLAPRIVEDILEGRQPVELTARALHRMTDLPLCWEQQRARLGFA